MFIQKNWEDHKSLQLKNKYMINDWLEQPQTTEQKFLLNL